MVQVGEQKAPLVQANFLAAIPLLKKLFVKQPPQTVKVPEPTPQPEWFNTGAAGMKFTLHDENNTPLYSETMAVGNISPAAWGRLVQKYDITQNGTIEVELFNYNTTPAFFDDWHIELTENSKPEIVQEIAYDPWGLFMEDESYFKDESGVTPPSGAGGLLLFNRKELQTYADLNLYDYHWRQYDPQLGRWHSPDPADQFYGISGYAYCANNPVMLTDPDGRIVPLLAAAFLLFTDTGYDIQKAVLPIAVHVDLSLGSHSTGLGFDMSVGIPQIFPISYRVEVGATYYLNRIGGYGAGWQTRIGAEWGIGIAGWGIRYGGTQYRDFDMEGNLESDQVVHRAKVGNAIFNLMYENDTRESFPVLSDLPFLPSLRDMATGGSSDRYRTARGRVRLGLFEAEMMLHTGEPNGVDPTTGAFFTGGSINDPRRSNGILSFSFGGFLKIGWDSENIRHTFQNHFAHDFMNGGNNGSAYPWILRTNRNSSFFFQFGGF